MSTARSPVLTLETINPAVLDVQYAVRGELALKADKYMQELDQPGGGKNLPFDKVVTANIGNPQQKGLNQRPITFWRQIISLLEYPDLMEEHLEVAKKIYPADVIKRAQSLRKEIGSVGAYTPSKGVLAIRQRVAKFLQGEWDAWSGRERGVRGACAADEDRAAGPGRVDAGCVWMNVVGRAERAHHIHPGEIRWARRYRSQIRTAGPSIPTRPARAHLAPVAGMWRLWRSRAPHKTNS